ncbi:MAG: hypothetical protein HKN47_03610 [Pirellulaceae bacterium]|nr:hypothetical protein [Pirellulaceae bacterium]
MHCLNSIASLAPLTGLLVLALWVTPTTAESPRVQPPAEDASSGPKSFRVVIQIFEGDSNSVVAEHLILFHDGVFYDLDNVGKDIVTIYDPMRQRVVLLDHATKVRATVGTNDLTKMTAELRANASTKQLKDRLGMSASVAHDAESNQYTIAYGTVQYTTTVQTPDSPAAALQFGQFADWASRLNIARKRGLPPFGRMSLNQRIASDGQIPQELKLVFKQGGDTSSYRSTHQLTQGLTKSDREEIKKLTGMLALYGEVPLKEFP